MKQRMVHSGSLLFANIQHLHIAMRQTKQLQIIIIIMYCDCDFMGAVCFMRRSSPIRYSNFGHRNVGQLLFYSCAKCI